MDEAIMKFEEVTGFDLLICSHGRGQSRLIIISSGLSLFDVVDEGERVMGTNIVVVGKGTKRELTRLIKQHGRPYINKHSLIPGGNISSSTMTALRKHLLDRVT